MLQTIPVFVRLHGFFAECKITKPGKRGLVKSDNSVYPRAERLVSAHILSRLHFMKCGSFEWADFCGNAALICLVGLCSAQVLLIFKKTTKKKAPVTHSHTQHPVPPLKEATESHLQLCSILHASPEQYTLGSVRARRAKPRGSRHKGK